MIRDSELNIFKRWILGYMPVLSIILMVFISGLFAYTYFLTYKTELFIKQWSCEGKIVRAADWDLSLEKLKLANKINPWDSDIYFSLGSLYEWKAMGEAVWNEESRQMRSEAIRHYKQSLKHRPTWSLAWLNLAQSMLLNREAIGDTLYAIEMGFKYGKQNPDVSKKLIFMSIGIWNSLPANIKKLVRDQVKFKLDHDDPVSNYAALALRFKWFDELSNLVTKPKDKEYLELVKANPQLLKGAMRDSLSNENDFVC